MIDVILHIQARGKKARIQYLRSYVHGLGHPLKYVCFELESKPGRMEHIISNRMAVLYRYVQIQRRGTKKHKYEEALTSTHKSNNKKVNKDKRKQKRKYEKGNLDKGHTKAQLFVCFICIFFLWAYIPYFLQRLEQAHLGLQLSDV